MFLFSLDQRTAVVFPTARSERYCHLGSDDDDDETNDDESSLELRQFSSVAHRFSKVVLPGRTTHAHILH